MRLPVNPQAQAGQALLLGLVLLGACVIALMTSWNIGQLVHDKYSLKRAADASAYSAALVQARALNFHAYLNRAQIAHLVAMKHLVVLASAEKFRATQANRSMQRNPPALLISALFGPQYGMAYQASQVGGPTAEPGLKLLETAFQRHDDTVRQFIERSRLDQIKHIEVMRKSSLESILLSNIGDNGSSMKGTSLSSLGILVRTTRDDLGQRVKAFTTKNNDWQSMLKQSFEPYRYLSERDFIHRSYWAINIRCPHRQNELRRRGSVSYNANGDWESNDSLSYHAIRFNKLIGCYHREYPMGWARLTAGKREDMYPDESIHHPRNFSQQPFWRWVSSSGITNWNIFSGSNNYLAKGWAYMDTIRWKSRGSRHFASMTGDLTKPIKFGIEVKQNAEFLRSKYPIKEIKAISVAETYYARPETRLDGYDELPNLFNPYWQARLTNEE